MTARPTRWWSIDHAPPSQGHLGTLEQREDGQFWILPAMQPGSATSVLAGVVPGPYETEAAALEVVGFMVDGRFTVTAG